MNKFLLACSLLILSLVGCSTVPVYMNLPQQNSGLYLNTDKAKFPFEVAVFLPDSFSNFSLNSTTANTNITYDFKYDVGNDFTETLPEFLGKRFKNVTVVKSLDGTDKFDYVFIPSVAKSRISTRINTTMTQEPAYALEINLGVVINKNGKEYSSTNFRESTEKVTEIACWTCWGKEILNQKKITDEYSSVLSNIYTKLDAYLTEVVK